MIGNGPTTVTSRPIQLTTVETLSVAEEKYESMERANALFVLLVALSVGVGATVAADFGSEIDTVGNVVPVVQDQVTTEVTEVRIVDEQLRVTVRIDNPTGYDLRLTGAFFRMSNETDVQIVAGAATRIDDGPSTIPAKGSLRVSYEVPIHPSQVEEVRAALERGATLSGRLGVVLNDHSFTVQVEPRPVSAGT